MIINIDDKTRIKGTEDSWQLELMPDRKPDSKSKDWKVKGYYTTLRKALEGALQREIRTHPAEGISDAMQALDDLAAKYSAVFDTAQAMQNVRY